MKFFAVFSPIIACAAAFAANNHSEQLDAPNGGDAFVFVQPLKVAYPQNIAESDKPAFLEKARARITSPLLREVVITTEAVKCEGASKKFSAPYPNKSAREIVAENFSIEPTSDPEIVNVKFAHKDKSSAKLFCLDLAHNVAYSSRNISEEILKKYLELSQICLKLAVERKKLFEKYSAAQKSGDRAETAKIRAQLDKKIPTEIADDTKFVLGEIKKSTPFWQLLEQ